MYADSTTAGTSSDEFVASVSFEDVKRNLDFLFSQTQSDVSGPITILSSEWPS
jgi:hypothetical protein